MDPLKMYFLLKMVVFHCYVSLLEGSTFSSSAPFESGRVSNSLPGGFGDMWATKNTLVG